MENEVWKDITNYEGLYQISNLGRIKSLKRYEKCGEKLRIRNERFLKQRKTMGYFYVILCKNGKSKTYRTHKLVAKEFVSNPLNFLQVNHIDGNKENNFANNLEWCTCKYNIQEAYRLKLCKTKKIKQYDLKGNYIKTWESIASASKELGLDASAITKCCKKKRNKCGNYFWQYDNEKTNGQDGYAGVYGVSATKFQITIE